MSQGDMFGDESYRTDAFARATDPTTSLAAAESIRSTDLEQKVLDIIIILNGATTHEIAEYSGISLVSASPRIRPLVRKGFIRDSGERRVGRSNRKSIVWEIV